MDKTDEGHRHHARTHKTMQEHTTRPILRWHTKEPYSFSMCNEEERPAQSSRSTQHARRRITQASWTEPYLLRIKINTSDFWLDDDVDPMRICKYDRPKTALSQNFPNARNEMVYIQSGPPSTKGGNNNNQFGTREPCTEET